MESRSPQIPGFEEEWRVARGEWRGASVLGAVSYELGKARGDGNDRNDGKCFT